MRPSGRFIRPLRAALASCVVVAAMLIAPAPADACPTCKDAIAENDPQHAQLVKGYFYSIVFMMSMPFVVLGSFGGMAYCSVKRARQNPTNAEQPATQTLDDE